MGPQNPESVDEIINLGDYWDESGIVQNKENCALFPEKLEHIVVPEMDISLTTANKYHIAEVKGYKRFDFRQYLDGYVVDKYSDVLGYDMAEFERLLERAVYTIKKAKAAHDSMEQYYIPNMTRYQLSTDG